MQRSMLNLGLAACALFAFLPQPALADTVSSPAIAGAVDARPTPLIDAAGLDALRPGERLLLVAVTGGDDGQEEASALRISLSADLTGPRTGTGLYPPPTPAQLGALVERLGLTPGTRLVLASEGHVRDAARAWLVLRWAGFDNVAVLDGGVAAARGLSVPGAAKSGVSQPDLDLRGGGFPVLDAAGASAFAERGALIDARVATLYAAGHIPGALNLPAPLLVADDGTLLKRPALEALFAERGLCAGEPVAVYGNGGVGAAVLVLALEAAGYPVFFYWDSWPDWRSDPQRPIARGAAPSSRLPSSSPSE